MANLCERLISSCVGADCENPVFSGMGSTAYIFNKSEIASFTYDSSNPNIITAINMKTHEVDNADVAYTGYTITQLGKTPFTGTTTELTEGNAGNTFTETFAFTFPDNSPVAANLLDNIANGKFVVVAQNEYDGSDHKGGFQVFGAKKGLTCATMARDAYGEDADGGWTITLTAEKTPNSALFLHHETTPGTDDTATYIESLVDCE